MPVSKSAKGELIEPSSFNTTTSMGRLTLNVLLSFAQFEREVTAERIRDKIAASKKKGIFMGGRVPMGYRVENRKLHIIPEQAEVIRTIFEVYLAIRSTIGAGRVLTERGIVTQVHVAKDGSTVGGIPFAYGSLQWVLRNRIYVGEISHKGEYYPSEHEAIIDRMTFDKVQALLTNQRSSPTRTSHKMRSLLTSKIYDSNGNRMAPSHSNKRGLRYRYYVSRALLDGAPDKAGTPARIPAIAIETLVTETLRKQQHANSQAGSNYPGSGKAGAMQQKRLDASGSAHADHPHKSDHNDAHRLVETMLEHVEVYENRIVLTLIPEDKGDNLHVGDESSTGCANDEDDGMDNHGGTNSQDEGMARSGKPSPKPRQIVIPCALGQQPLVNEVIVSQAADANTAEPTLPNSQRRNRARLVEAIRRARGWFDELHTGKTESLEVIATREGRSLRNVSMMLNLAFLAPKIIESILTDKMPAHLSASHIAQNLPLDWEDQQRWITAQA
jgi:site-specific DNA recombinase